MIRIPNSTARLSLFRTIGIVFTTAATVVLLQACGDTTTGPGVVAASLVSFVQGDKTKDKVKELHFARVKGNDGMLVDGTATSSSRIEAGAYDVTFPTPIDKCAVAANAVSFGPNAAPFVLAQVLIGIRGEDSRDDRAVSVRFRRPEDLLPADASFSLVMVCP